MGNPKRPHLLEFGTRWPPETFISRKLERLAAAGFRVTVASIGESQAARTPPKGVEHIPTLVEGRLRNLARAALGLLRVLFRSPTRTLAIVRAAGAPTASGRPVGHREALGRLAMYSPLAALRPDVVHFEWTSTAVHFWSLIDALGCPYVISCHGGDLQILPHTSDGRREAVGFAPVFRRAAAVHFVSGSVLTAAGCLGLDCSKARLIGAAVDPDFFRPVPKKSREGLRSFSIVAIGTLWWVKGFEYALRAVDVLDKEGVPLSLDILGSEPDWGEPSERERLLALSAALGLDGKVRLHGGVLPEAVRDRLQTADVYLQSSLSEGHPTAVVEAMASGVPVVATDCGGTREVLTDGVEGFLVPPRDWRAAGSALRLLWHDHDLRKRMGEAGRRRVEAEFTIDRQTDHFVGLYRGVLERCS